jgi:hypothetical protein
MATTTQALAQTTINIAAALQNGIRNGQYIDVYDAITDLCTAVIALTEAYNATLVAAAASTSTAVAGVTPVIGSQYSAVQSLTATPVITGIR